MTNHGVVLGPEDATAVVAVARHFSFPPSRTAAGHSLHRRRRWSVVKLARRRVVSSVIGAANVGMGIKQQINLTRHLAGEIALPDEAPASAADCGTTTTTMPPYLQQHEASSTSFLPRNYFFAQVTGSSDLASFVTECGTHVCVRAGTRLICGTTTITARMSHGAAMAASKGNEPSSFWIGNLTEAQKIQALVNRHWPNTFRLDCAELGKPIGPVSRQRSWGGCLGRPMVQGVPDTCALVSCGVAVEAVHRLHHDAVHGEGAAFNYRALAPDVWLLHECQLDGVWTPGEGAYVGAVLAKIQQMGGVPATATATTTTTSPAEFLLPLRSWKEHGCGCDNGSDGGGLITPDRVAALLDRHGPCVGVLWVCPWYGYFDAARDGGTSLVYRGCGRSQQDRRKSEELYGRRWPVGWHAVVCFAYRRFFAEEMHVLVLDNHDDKTGGPRRWVHVEELDTLYTLAV